MSLYNNTVRFLLRSSAINIRNHNFIGEESVRFLYSKEMLGIDGYLQQKTRFKNQMGDIEEKFRNKMTEYVEDGSKNIIFTEDLKNMVHIAENDDVNLVMKMVKRFNQQNKQLRFGNFVFGPVIMRMFYTLNKPNEALECFRVPELEGFFDQLISYQLLLDLLYENKLYNDILDTFDMVTSRQIEGNKYPRNIVVLTLAACYKLNTKETLDFALKLWSKLSEVGHMPTRRASTFCAGLALNQNKPDFALEILSQVSNQNYTSVRNLKVIALVQLGRIHDTIPIIKSIFSQEAVHTFSKDTVDIVKSHIAKGLNPDVEAEIDQMLTYLKEQGRISDVTVDEQLCSEISFPTNARQTSPFNRNRYTPRYNTNYRNERTSLKDLQ